MRVRVICFPPPIENGFLLAWPLADGDVGVPAATGRNSKSPECNIPPCGLSDDT